MPEGSLQVFLQPFPPYGAPFFLYKLLLLPTYIQLLSIPFLLQLTTLENGSELQAIIKQARTR